MESDAETEAILPIDFSREYVSLILKLRENNQNLDASLYKLRSYQQQQQQLQQNEPTLPQTLGYAPYAHLLDPSRRNANANGSINEIFSHNQIAANDVVNFIATEVGQHLHSDYHKRIPVQSK